MIKSNFHTHTVFCDGADTAEEMVNQAIKKGFVALGFSGHSFFTADDGYSMSPENAVIYRQTVNMLKEKYKDSIDIYCGIEQEYFSYEPIGCYDYIIGSVHYVYKGGKYLPVDASKETFIENLQKYYDNDFDAMAEDYFDLVSNVVNKTNADIIGHFDLILKYSEQIGITQTPRFLAAAERAIKQLVPFNRPFEINTGAMSRGARSIPYPTPEILKMIKDNGGKITVSSDCHDKNYLDYAFDKAEEFAKEYGFTEYGIICTDGIKYIEF